MKIKQIIAEGVLLSAAALSQPVLALDCNAGGGQLISDWAASGETCDWQGLKYAYLSSSAELTDVYAQTKYQAGQDVLNFTTWDTVPLPTAPYQIQYSVEIDLTVRPGQVFTAASLSSDTGSISGFVNGTSMMTRTLYATSAMNTPLAPTLLSFNSGFGGTNTAIAGLTKLWVLDTFNWNGDIVMNSSTDYLITADAPEPATLALFGVGLAGLAARNRRVRKV